jgi:hypothetical protein
VTYSTVPEDVDVRRLRRARALRRLFVLALTVTVVAGLAGAFGVRSQTNTASAGEWTLEVRYPRTTRAGLAVPLAWKITKEGGWDEGETVVMRMRDEYMDLLDENGFSPTPSSEWSDEEYVYWEFDAPPDSDVMRVSTDTRTGSSVQLVSKTADASVMEDDEPVVTVKFTTWVAP